MPFYISIHICIYITSFAQVGRSKSSEGSLRFHRSAAPLYGVVALKVSAGVVTVVVGVVVIIVVVVVAPSPSFSLLSLVSVHSRDVDARDR